MTKKTKHLTLYASFLPLIIVLAIIFGAGYFLMQGEFELPSFGTDITEVRRLGDFPTVVFTKAEIDKQRRVIKNQEDLEEFFNTVSPEGELILLEEIDWENEMLLGVSTESQDTTGYELKVRKVYADEDDQSLLISLRETRPGEACEVDVQNNVMVDLVAITKTDWDINFERIKEVDECN